MTLVQHELAPEIIWFTPSEELLDDPPKTLTQIHQTSFSKGMLGSYYGVDADNEQAGVFIMTWKSLEHHQAFMQDESYIDFIMPVMDSMVGPGDIQQMRLRDFQELEIALTAPVTAFIYITVRPLHDRGYELEPLVNMIRSELKTVPGYLGSSWGPSIADSNVEIGIVGWRSLRDRLNATRGRLSPLYTRIRELSSKLEIRYATLSHHTIVDLSRMH
ncbi:hypothetical protein FA13DRAFT_1751049 [Coprinellus micaceus]|uniref:ABM domain-containing protein n=1 Tax=Coprinellus micaceus TaxID=71717 RepID=A0A4Y7U017_COPMI|nr:hypothetical protein FA13DRAFT_1751049 [Coprinellus micaceus]